MAKSFVMTRYRATSIGGRSLTMRLGRTLVNASATLRTPWLKYHNNGLPFFFHVERQKLGWRIALRVLSAYGRFDLQRLPHGALAPLSPTSKGDQTDEG